MIERVDYYSDDEYKHALALEEEFYKEEQAREKYAKECAFQEYLLTNDIN